MLYYLKKGKNATETHTQKFCAVYGGVVLTDQTCQLCFVKFLAEDFLRDDAPWSGR